MTEATAFAHAIRSFPCRSTSVIRVVLLTIKNAPIVVLTKRSNTKANLHRTTLERARQITEKRYQQRVRLKLNLCNNSRRWPGKRGRYRSRSMSKFIH